jgi:hypothetical protein
MPISLSAPSASVPPSLLAAGYHTPLVIALPIIAAVLIAKVVFSRSRGRPALLGKVVVRCSKGHIFTTRWSPLGSLTSIRLGSARFQRCPIGHHWSLVKPVNEADLTDAERSRLRQDAG